MRADLSGFLLGTALLTSGACGGDDSGPSALGGGCGSVTDCQPGLSCEFRICQQPCTSDSQCPGAERCVTGLRSDDAGTAGHVCQLPDNTACERATDCLGAQVCRVGECRDECTSTDQCTSGQVCANGGACASRDPNKDRVDVAGNIVPDGTGSALLDAASGAIDAAADAR